MSCQRQDETKPRLLFRLYVLNPVRFDERKFPMVTMRYRNGGFSEVGFPGTGFSNPKPL